MLHKAFNVTDFKSSESGEFTATFSFFDTPDADQDVTLRGAFTDGAVVPVSSWGHNWGTNPTGVATLRPNKRGTQAVGRFFVETSHGRDAYLTVKGLADQGRGQWSYGFTILDSEPGTWEGKPVRFLKRLEVHEVSPVIVGSQGQSSTDAIKNGPMTRQQRELLGIRRAFAQREIRRVGMELLAIRELEAIRDKWSTRR